MSIVYKTKMLPPRIIGSREYREAIAARVAREAAATLASKEVKHFSQKGDFTHLAAVGHLTSAIK